MALPRAGNIILRKDRYPFEADHWFALNERRPLFAFTGERKEEASKHQPFAFLITESSDIVRPIHAKAMPVLLMMAEQWETWLTGSVEEAIALQKRLANEMLHIVATGEKSDHTPMPCPAFTSDKQPVIGDVIAPVSTLQDRLPHRGDGRNALPSR
jgi:hypothetical protein